MRGAMRLALLSTPLLVVPSGSCDWEEDAAAALLLTLPACYLLALVVVALFVWLWRTRPTSVGLDWRWLLSYAGVTGVIAMITALRPLDGSDYLSGALLFQTLFLCACLCMVARVAILSDSRWVIRIGTAFMLTMVAVPAMLVFFVSRNARSHIMDTMLTVLVDPWSVLWGAILVVLFIEALVRGRLSSARADPAAPP